MAFKTHLFLLFSLSILVSFPVQSHRSLLPFLDNAPASAPASSSPEPSPSDAEYAPVPVSAPVPASSAPAPAPVLDTLSNIISSSISFSPNGSPSPSPSSKEDTTEYEEALLDYLGSNKEIEFQNKITPVVQKIVQEVKDKTSVFVQETIEKRLADPNKNEIEKKCMNLCKTDYEDMRNDITEVLNDFSMTHNFEMISDYLHGLNYDVQTCRNCRAEDDVDFNKFDEWLTSMGNVSAAELNKTMHV